MTSDSEKFWYNLKTGKVEKGFESPVVDRAGPWSLGGHLVAAA